MHKHCAGCKAHWNARHPKGSRFARKHNDWCCKFGGHAPDKIGHCKLYNAKELKDD